METIAENVPKVNLLDLASAATASTWAEAMRRYTRLGIATVPIAIGQKHPGIQGWQNLGHPTEAQIRDWEKSDKFWGVGLRPGALSKNLIYIDCDGMEVYQAFCKRFPDLAETYTERSGSGNGVHIFLQVDRLPQIHTGKVIRKGIFGDKELGLEIFFETGQVVVAPSMHPSGNRYRVHKDLPVLRVSDIDDLVEWACSLETVEGKKKPPPNTCSTQQTRATSNGDVWPEIEQALGVTSYKGNGWSSDMACIFAHHENDGHQPRAGIHRDGCYHCHKCNKTYGKRAIAKQLGIRWKESPYDEKTIDLDRAPDDSPREWFIVLPDSWRTVIMITLKPAHVLLIELLFVAAAAGLINLQDFTVPDLQAANEALPDFAIRKTPLYRAVGELAGDLFPFFHTIESAPPLVGNSGNNSTRGPKPIHYRLNPYDQVKAELTNHLRRWIYEQEHPVDGEETLEGSTAARPTAGMMLTAGVPEVEAGTVAAELDQALGSFYRDKDHVALKRAKKRCSRLEDSLDDWHSTPLPEGWPLDNAPNYHAAYTHARVAADPPGTQRSGAELAEMNGIDRRSVPALRKRAGVQAHSEKTEVEVQSLADIRAYGKPHRAFAYSLAAFSVEGRFLGSNRAAESYPDFIQRQRSVGARIIAYFQHTSTHEIVRETPPEPVTRQPKANAPEMESCSTGRPQKPRPERYVGPGYDPRWGRKQLRVDLQLLGWRRIDELLIDPETGEIAPEDPVKQIERMIGREIRPPAQDEEPGTSSDNGSSEPRQGAPPVSSRVI